MAEVNRVSTLSLLRQLDLRDNPVGELPDYRLAVVFSVQQLTELDGSQISVDDKVTILPLLVFSRFQFTHEKLARVIFVC